MDRGHTLDQVTTRFCGVKDGLPELVKNSKDQYSRHGLADRAIRQIIVLADTTALRLGVLDFAGARASDFDGWTTWSSRSAGRKELAEDIEAGHGNGGKAFMVRGATEFAFLESCFGGKRTRMGFKNEKPSDKYKPGYAKEKGVRINNVAEADPEARLESYLAGFQLRLSNLPERARAAFVQRGSFTGVFLSGVADWKERRRDKVKRLAEEGLRDLLASHGQAAMTIETCEVWVIVDGRLMTPSPIAPLELEPYPGFPMREIAIPDILLDPETGEPVDITTGQAGPRYLRLCTSAKQLQLSDETKARNVIRLWNERNNVATWALQSLGVLMTPVSFIYGELRCPALVGTHLAGAERVHLSDTPLVRALQDWTRHEVHKLAEELQKAMMGENKPRDREQAKNVLQGLRNLMRQYLDPDAAGSDDDDTQGGTAGIDGKGRKRKRKPTDYGTRIDEIVLEAGRTKIAIAQGTAIDLRFKCIERGADGSMKPVKAEGVIVRTSSAEVATVASDGKLRAHQPGECELWAETADGGVRSNVVICESVVATDVDVGLPAEVLLQGQRVKLLVTFQTVNGPRDDLLIEGSIDEMGMGLLARGGTFTAGFKEGNATVRIRHGALPQNQRATALTIGPERIPLLEEEGSRGSDIPEILLCGEKVSGMEDIPEDQRTVAGGDKLPTIIEDPLFPNVVWINPTSKEAMRVRGSRGGSSGVSSIASKNFVHFVALKCFDVLKRLHVRQALRGQGAVTEYNFIQLAAFAEVECAAFIDAAWEISDELLKRSGTEQTQ